MNFIELDGVGLRYELSGRGDRTLVLVHEMAGSLESFDDVVPRFAASRRVLRYDTRGAGLSQKVRGELRIDTMADDIAGLLDALGIAGKVAVAGMPSAARSPFISRRGIPSAPARSRSAVRPPALHRNVALRRLNGSSRSKPPAWLSPSPIRCRTVMPRSFTATSAL